MVGLGQPAPMRRVFVSYHHGGDQAYYDAFSRHFGGTFDVLSDRSLDRARNSDDPNYIMRYIRENHLTGASTLIVLCGLQTSGRKYVDWEIQAGLAQGMALLGVKLPELQVIEGGCEKPARLQDNLSSGYASWVWWENFAHSPESVSQWIENANSRAKRLINNSRARRLRDG